MIGQPLTAAQVRAWRKDTALSLPAFGHMLGVSHRTISNWESDAVVPPRWLTMARIGWYAHRSLSAQIIERLRA